MFIPTFSICNLMGADRCITEIIVTRISDFMAAHGKIVFPHRHDFYQIVLFTSTGGSHSIDFERYEIVPNQVYYMAPGQIHTWEFEPDTEGYIINFTDALFTSVCHNPHFIREFPLFSSLIGVQLNQLSPAFSTEMKGYFEQMLHEFRNGGEYHKDILRGVLLVILVKLSREAPTVLKEGASRHNILLVQQFEQYIEANFKQKRLPREYAEMLFITPNHLNALTNAIIGKSAGEIIRDRVLLEAKRMLVNSDLMIAQIADVLHFEDNAYFARFFKKYTGVTPENFRKNNPKVSVS